MALKFLSPVHKATRQISLYMESPMARLGVTNSEGHLLSYLRTYGPSPISELVRVFGLKPSTLTSILDRLNRRGLVERRVREEDRRSFEVRLTGEGRIVARRVNRVVAELEAAIDRRVSKKEMDGFCAVMAAIGAATTTEVRAKERS